jgi:hypothetical protein
VGVIGRGSGRAWTLKMVGIRGITWSMPRRKIK